MNARRRRIVRATAAEPLINRVGSGSAGAHSIVLGDRMALARATHHWQVTVRSSNDSAPVQTAIADTILPLVRQRGVASHIALAGCINCAGEFTYMADWPSVDEVDALERSEAYRDALQNLEPHLRLPPKRELWRLLG